ncbi:MAG: DNA-processing protein DprA [Nitriliruptoraceae bacterium]
MVSHWRNLDDAAARVVADGTDTALLVALMLWLVPTKRSPAALRQSCRDGSWTVAQALDQAHAALPPAAATAAAASQLLETWHRCGVRVAVVGDVAYPSRMAAGWPELPAPVFLAWRGVPPDEAPAIAMVGARRASAYGRGVAGWLAEALGAAGVRIVSGGALGIDAAAHEAAHQTPGSTTVVLGCGHAVRYPRAHAHPGGLFDQIIDHGGTIVSEFLPHEPPRANRVRERNRIIAALADAVVVIEGGARSGSLITAGAAGEWGRQLFAVPGDIRAPQSVAPHQLLRDGAAPCTAPDDLLEALDIREPHDQSSRVANPVSTLLPDQVWKLLADRWPYPMSLDELADTSGVSAAQLLAVVTRATAAGELADGVDGVRFRRAPGDVP